MARRRLTIKRLDPWSVLKFGAVVNVAVLAIVLLVVGVIFFFVDRLGLIDQACDIARDVGFTACGLNIGNLFRAVALLGLLATIVQTAVLVFLAFLHNLIADLTGGLTISVIDDGPTQVRPAPATAATTTGGTSTSGSGRPPVPPIGSDAARAGSGPGSGATSSHPTGSRSADARRDRRDRDDVDRTASLRRDDDELFGGR